MNDRDSQQSEVAKGFETAFGTAPALTRFAPGRVNLLGEHTDYNGGYVLPMALENLGVAIALSDGNAPGEIEIHSLTLKDQTRRNIADAPAGHWSDYVLGAIQAVVPDHLAETGLRIALLTSLPLGAGLSSSAALEVATLRAVTAHFSIPLNPVEIAKIAQKVENDFVGMPCGIMDQFAASVGEPGTALFLNTNTLEFAAAPALDGHSFLIIDSAVSHQLTDSGYATRVAECKSACEALGIDTLSDLSLADMDQIQSLPEPLNRRAAHVVIDNNLTSEGLAALQKGDAMRFGQLMSESHATERDNYEITVPETDALVVAAEKAGALGARQTGGGWGGAIVALVPDSKVASIRDELARDFPQTRLLAVT